ncbi:MucB/RseB C-terminal domain-containing protein [Niveibacterium umoris]|uniref:Sigma-E factor negative regulatory protein RseB n=1 Tax=Niveibacterium umoris TaxID=1193620 RepID=A0A840BCY9_9RHOO|nr:MucB/RseB C-terminal domain-containing protein [Niveibacterium umoris]MBB4010900.1 sigma-E factor negative regulatory protein RseB [Niveibacterium umoris]
MRRALVACCCAIAVMSPASAADRPDAIAWLGKVSSAAASLTFSGTFVYQAGKSSETSRIAHITDATGDYERLETLDGPPREIVRSNGEVRFYLPQEKIVISDHAMPRRFPAWSHFSPDQLAGNYGVRMGSLDRVAGLPAQQVLLDARDGLRYSHVFWIEPASGLLLKSRMLDANGGSVEQFAFSEVTIGGLVERDKVRSSYAVLAKDWREINARGEVVKPEENWVTCGAHVPGFKQISAVRRRIKAGGAEALHLVFSDGLATISVFVEPTSGSSTATLGESSTGPTRIFKRALTGQYLVTALGEVPPETVRRLAEAIEIKRK